LMGPDPGDWAPAAAGAEVVVSGLHLSGVHVSLEDGAAVSAGVEAWAGDAVRDGAVALGADFGVQDPGDGPVGVTAPVHGGDGPYQ
jgi:hypothetical protein